MQKENRRRANTDHNDNTRANTSNPKGICLNCENADSCRFAAFGDAIVFCEEHTSNYDAKGNDRLCHKNFGNIPSIGVTNLIPCWHIETNGNQA